MPEPYKTAQFALLPSAQTVCARIKKRYSAINIQTAGILLAKP